MRHVGRRGSGALQVMSANDAGWPRPVPRARGRRRSSPPCYRHRQPPPIRLWHAHSDRPAASSCRGCRLPGMEHDKPLAKGGRKRLEQATSGYRSFTLDGRASKRRDATTIAWRHRASPSCQCRPDGFTSPMKSTRRGRRGPVRACWGTSGGRLPRGRSIRAADGRAGRR